LHAFVDFTGKYAESQADEPKRWKANFRCALNSLPDVREVKNAGQTRGNSPFKVYELSEEVNRKNTLRSKYSLHSQQLTCILLLLVYVIIFLVYCLLLYTEGM
jgi:Interferon regulatory factor transcription factor